MRANCETAAIIVEEAENNLSGYVPDVPGCVSTADTREEWNELVRRAIELHIEGMIEDGLPVPEPTSRVDYAEVAA